MKNILTKNKFLNEIQIQDFYSTPKYLGKIIKCSKESGWYKDLIGKMVIVSDDSRNSMWKVVPKEVIDVSKLTEIPESELLLYNSSAVRWINKEDCEIIREID